MSKRLALPSLSEIGRRLGMMVSGLAATAALGFVISAAPAKAAPYLVIDQDSGAVLADHDAT
jgi:D-alanyl-D-alanine carboxypeptidase